MDVDMSSLGRQGVQQVTQISVAFFAIHQEEHLLRLLPKNLKHTVGELLGRLGDVDIHPGAVSCALDAGAKHAVDEGTHGPSEPLAFPQCVLLPSCSAEESMRFAQ